MIEPGVFLFGLFLLLLFVGVPILTSLGVTALLFLWQFNLGLQVTASNVYANIAKFPLLAIPFFILAGFVMDRVGLSRGLVHLLNLIIGPVRGGLGLVAVNWSYYTAIDRIPVGVAIALQDTAPVLVLVGVALVARRSPGSVVWVAGLLTLGGAVKNPLTLTYVDVLALPASEVTATLDCTSGWYTTQVWRGVPLVDLLAQAGLRPEALAILLKDVSGYPAYFTLAEAQEILLATHSGGQVFDHWHGFPLRAVVP